ncbi:MAG TPA: SCO family protein [Methylophilaceae bacterium]|nr:SCO family protein [Methylophilaceae bacterium]
MQANTVSPASRPASKLIPTLVLIVAFLPIAASVLLYVSGWRPTSTVNHGELITPALPLADHALHDVDGKVVKFSDLRGQWVMLYLDAADCPAACMDSLYRMRQTYIAQGKERERIERVFIATDGGATPALKAKLADYAGMQIWAADATALSAIANDFGMDAGQLAQQHNIYLIDPMGNYFMRYSPTIDPAGLRKDLERLLKYSAAG